VTRHARDDGPALFEPVVRERRLADQVADRLRQTILSGQLKPGDALAPERDLSQQFGVSRTVVREAVRSLSGQGLVQAIGGSGVRVLAVDAGTVGESMRALMQSADVDYGKVDEIRRVIEVAAVGFAAERATPEDLAVMEQTLTQMREHIDDLEVCAQADLAFHRALALATHNELFLMLHDSMYAPLIEVRRHNLARGVTRRRKTVTAHRKILSAVRHGDAGQAAAMMREHLGEVRRGWSETVS
jgi:GntR family transcriptional regulator, transcriptional repressor for pyruvate dehydrogenase complex